MLPTNIMFNFKCILVIIIICFICVSFGYKLATNADTLSIIKGLLVLWKCFCKELNKELA